MATFLLTLVDTSKTDLPAYTEEYPEKYSKRFTVGMESEFIYESPYVVPEHHAFIKAFMNQIPDDSPYWDLIDTNEDIQGETKELYFDLDPVMKNFLTQYVGQNYYRGEDGDESWGTHRFIYETTAIFHKLECRGPGAIVGQYLADYFTELSAKDDDNSHVVFADALAIPLEDRVYIKRGLDTKEKRDKYKSEQPTFDDVIRAVHKKIPNAKLPRFYPNIINGDPDGPVQGPALTLTPEQMTPIVAQISQEIRDEQGAD